MGVTVSRVNAEDMGLQPGTRACRTEVVVQCPNRRPQIKDVYFCRSCEFEVLQSKSKLAYILEWVFLAVEMLLGIVLFAIELHFDFAAEVFGRYYVNFDEEYKVRGMLVRTRFIHGVTCAFPFIFVPIMLITKLVMDRDSVISISCIILGFVGFLCYLFCGLIAFCVQHLNDDTTRLVTALYGSFALVICLVYLGHACYETYRNRIYLRRHCRGAMLTCGACFEREREE